MSSKSLKGLQKEAPYFASLGLAAILHAILDFEKCSIHQADCVYVMP